jgi:hypothetical protein
MSDSLQDLYIVDRLQYEIDMCGCENCDIHRDAIKEIERLRKIIQKLKGENNV